MDIAVRRLTALVRAFKLVLAALLLLAVAGGVCADGKGSDKNNHRGNHGKRWQNLSEEERTKLREEWMKLPPEKREELLKKHQEKYNEWKMLSPEKREKALNNFEKLKATRGGHKPKPGEVRKFRCGFDKLSPEQREELHVIHKGLLSLPVEVHADAILLLHHILPVLPKETQEKLVKELVRLVEVGPDEAVKSLSMLKTRATNLAIDTIMKKMQSEGASEDEINKRIRSFNQRLQGIRERMVGFITKGRELVADYEVGKPIIPILKPYGISDEEIKAYMKLVMDRAKNIFKQDDKRLAFGQLVNYVREEAKKLLISKGVEETEAAETATKVLKALGEPISRFLMRGSKRSEEEIKKLLEERRAELKANGLSDEDIEKRLKTYERHLKRGSHKNGNGKGSRDWYKNGKRHNRNNTE